MIFFIIKLLQTSHALEILDMKKGNILKDDKLIELTTSFFSQVSNLQGIIKILEQCLKLMEYIHEIHKNKSPKNNAYLWHISYSSEGIRLPHLSLTLRHP